MPKQRSSINIGLKDQERKAVAGILGRLLADESLLYTKTRNFHWNVTGPSFTEFHKFLEDHYDQLALVIDETAERIRMLGEVSPGSMAEFLKLARLKETPGAVAHADKLLKALLADHEALIQSIRTDIDATADKHGDTGNADFLTSTMKAHEKMAWMIRAYLS